MNTTADKVDEWVKEYNLNPKHVLLDPVAKWSKPALESLGGKGTPGVFFMHTSNMLIWDAIPGWVPTDKAEENHKFYTEELIPWALEQTGSTAD